MACSVIQNRKTNTSDPQTDGEHNSIQHGKSKIIYRWSTSQVTISYLVPIRNRSKIKESQEHLQFCTFLFHQDYQYIPKNQKQIESQDQNQITRTFSVLHFLFHQDYQYIPKNQKQIESQDQNQIESQEHFQFLHFFISSRLPVHN